MPKIENTLRGGIGLPTGQVIDGGSSIELDQKEWDAVKDHPVIASRLADGHLTASGGAKSAETDIEKMTVDELKAFLGTKSVQLTGDEKKAELLDLAREASK